MDNIELRSEKIRNIIGRVPPLLVRSGITITTIITVAIVAAFCLMPYPITVSATGAVGTDRQLHISVPYRYLYLFDRQRTARVTLEGTDGQPVIACTISSHSPLLIHTDKGNFFTANADIPSTARSTVQPYQKAEVSIVVSDKTMLQQILSRGHQIP